MVPAYEQKGPAFLPCDSQPQSPSSLHLLSEQAHSPSPCPTDDLLMSGAKFCLVLMLSLHPKVNTGCMLHMCLLKVHALSLLMNSYKFSHPFHQYVCNLSPCDYGNLLSYLGETDLSQPLE